MKELLKPSMRRNGLLAALGLVLAGSVVVGDENKRKEEQAVSQRAPNPQTKVLPANEELDLSPLRRARRDGPITDAFVPRTGRGEAPPPPPSPSAGAFPPSAEQAPPPPPAPAAPPLPFRYFGRIVNDGNASVYVLNGDKDHVVAPGSTIDGAYRVEALSDTAIVFTYLPLGLQQTLFIAEGTEK